MSVLLLPQVVVAEYPMFHHDPQRTGNVSGDAPTTANLMALFKNLVIAEHYTSISHHFHHVVGGKTIS